MQTVHNNPYSETKLANDFNYPVAAICEEDLKNTKKCNILKYNIFDENNIRRDIYLKRASAGKYKCRNIPGLQSSYESQFVLNKNLTEKNKLQEKTTSSEDPILTKNMAGSNMVWELREKRAWFSKPILLSINIEAGLNPRNIKNQFNMCDRNITTNEIKCRGSTPTRDVYENMEDVDLVDSVHETAPQCVDYSDLGLEKRRRKMTFENEFWSCDGVILTERKEPKILDERIFVGNQEFRKMDESNGTVGFEMVVDWFISYTIEFEGDLWKFYRKTLLWSKVLGKSVNQNIFGPWVGVCEDWKNLNSECGPHKYYKINSPAKEKKDCLPILDYNNFIPMQFNVTAGSYQGRMGAHYEASHSVKDMTWRILSRGNESIKTLKTPDFAAACPDDIDYLLSSRSYTDSRNSRLWIPDARPFPSGSSKAYDHLEYPWEHYRNDIISYCHGTCDQISVAVSLNGTREVLTFDENKWIGGDYALKLTHVDNTSHSVYRLYKNSTGNIIASSEVR